MLSIPILRSLYPHQLEALLRLVESDLRDSHNPAVLKKYPHLGDPALVQEAEQKVGLIRDRLSELREQQDAACG